MKKLLFLGIFLSGYLAMAQAYPRYNNNHELKFNAGLFLATGSVEGSYEYYFTEDTSFGGTVYFNNDATDYNGNFGIGPNLRAYFGYQPRTGLFVEAFGLYYTWEEEDLQDTINFRNNDYSTVALGLGLGNKWVTPSDNFTLEIYGGVGRNVNPEDFQDTFMFRGALSIGFRF